jgi:hypothetical protein
MNLIQFIQQHQAAATIAAMNAVHFAHLVWPRLVAIYPYCRDNGGAIGIAKQFLNGKPKTN